MRELHPRSASAVGTVAITVGMPVYNGAKHIAAALDSILAQTHADFELVVADNASTDDSAQIVATYAARDPRVRLIRHPANIGAARNWNSLVPLARGRYFKWASSNDLIAPTMLAECFRELEADASLILCNGRTMLIDERGEELGLFSGDVDATQPTPSERYEHVRRSATLNNLQGGLIRTSALRQTLLERVYPGGDMVFLAELALYGRFLLLPQALYCRRIGGDSSTLNMSEQALREFWNPGAQRKRSHSVWRVHFDHLKAAMRARIPLLERCRTAQIALRHARWDRVELWHALRCRMPGQGKRASG